MLDPESFLFAQLDGVLGAVRKAYEAETLLRPGVPSAHAWTFSLLGFRAVLSFKWSYLGGGKDGLGETGRVVLLSWPGVEDSVASDCEAALLVLREMALPVVAAEARRSLAAASRLGVDVVAMAEEAVVSDVLGA